LHAAQDGSLHAETSNAYIRATDKVKAAAQSCSRPKGKQSSKKSRSAEQSQPVTEELVNCIGGHVATVMAPQVRCVIGSLQYKPRSFVGAPRAR
jgi:hypothetical protein